MVRWVNKNAALEVESMKNKGFTLVEILIVVIILGILAAIVIPQFTEASQDARTSALVSDLQTVRGQLELYKVQHNENYPHLDQNGVIDSAANFVLRLTGKTDQDSTINAAGLFGPYMQRFPSNPFMSVAADTVTLGIADPAPGDASSGWYFNTTLGKFSSNYDATTAAY
jgi:general secretion pathway protein G